jgi:hypothetical protein
LHLSLPPFISTCVKIYIKPTHSINQGAENLSRKHKYCLHCWTSISA